MSNAKEYIGKVSVHNIDNLETKIAIYSDRLRTTIAYIPYKELRHTQDLHLLSKEHALYFGGIFSDTLSIVTETGLEPRELLANRDELARMGLEVTEELIAMQKQRDELAEVLNGFVDFIQNNDSIAIPSTLSVEYFSKMNKAKNLLAKINKIE